MLTSGQFTFVMAGQCGGEGLSGFPGLRLAASILASSRVMRPLTRQRDRLGLASLDEMNLGMCPTLAAPRPFCLLCQLPK